MLPLSRPLFGLRFTAAVSFRVRSVKAADESLDNMQIGRPRNLHFVPVLIHGSEPLRFLKPRQRVPAFQQPLAIPFKKCDRCLDVMIPPEMIIARIFH